MRHSKRRYLTVDDFNKALKWSNSPVLIATYCYFDSTFIFSNLIGILFCCVIDDDV